MLHLAANRHPKATHQCLLMGVQACRLPALKRLKTLQTLKTLKTRHGGSKPAVCQSCQGSLVFKAWQTAGLDPPWRVVRVLSAWRVFKRLRAGKRQAWTPIRRHWCVALECLLAAGWSIKHKGTLACFIRQPTGTPRPHINVFLWASKPAVCQPLNA